MSLPNYSLVTLKLHVDFVLDVFAEGPYQVLYTEDMLSLTLDKLQSGSNVFIVNVPFFVDCPSHFKDLASFMKLFIDEFPYLDFCMLQNQYLVADLQVDYEEALNAF